MILYEHEFLKSDSNNRQWCKYCGVMWREDLGLSCVGRERDGHPATSRRKISALDDVDGLFERINELRKEALNCQEEGE